MNSRHQEKTTRLRIWQQNLNASRDAQIPFLNSLNPDDWDILALQEPHINTVNNTMSTRRYHAVYPTLRYSGPNQESRAVTLISTSIDSNTWIQLPFPSRDIVITQLTGPYGRCTIFNIYNTGISSETLEALSAYLEDNILQIRAAENDFMLWIGDFNRHHPLWEEERNTHLLTNQYLTEAQPLIELLAEYGMAMALPKDMPTLEALATRNWTRPDNVFCSDNTTESIVSCHTEPALRGPRTDHVPILTVLDLEVQRVSDKHTRNFKDVDWKKFKKKLSSKLAKYPTSHSIITEVEFQSTAEGITKAITETIEEIVPLSRPSPHAKRWWNRELTVLRKETAKAAALSYKMRTLPEHPSHEAHRLKRNEYSEAVRKAKKDHWVEWLENLNSEEVWIANKYLNADPSDGGPSRIPTLQVKQPGQEPTPASTNKEKSEALAKAFFPPPPVTSSVPEAYIYPEEITDPGEITQEQLERCIAKLQPYKAPGPDGIRNVVFKQCGDILTPHLLRIFRAVFLLKTYYAQWRDFTTVVLRKPGRPDYTVTKAYRPIALLNTTGKLLTSIVADQLTHLLEKHDLLPDTHFGGRPGRSTTDSLHLLEATVKNAWRSNRVASILFLDIEGAFPNAVTDRLLHNMRKRRIPSSLVEFTERALKGRRTKLSFDGYLSEWISITNGIGQGDPLSMVLYIIYNSDLVEIAKTTRNRERTLAFVDDAALIAIGDTFHETHQTLQNMLNRERGGFEWSKDHNSKFETSKFALMDFSMNRSRERPPMTIRGDVINPTRTHRFLGVIIDDELRWKAHASYAIGKGTAYVLQLRRLSLAAKGIPLTLMKQLYTTVAVPKMLYAVDVWLKPIYAGKTDKAQRGSIGVVKKLERVQRLAVISITGAMRTTATDVLEAHAKLIPIAHRVQNHCHQAVVRLAAHPDSHPITPLLKKAAKRYVLRHRSSLHHLTHAFNLDPVNLEKLHHSRRPPEEGTPYITEIAPTREEAVRRHDESRAPTKVYCDGSGVEGNIGAAAVIHARGQSERVMRYHLGTDKEHTVYEAEAVGLSLAVQLLTISKDIETPIEIYVDNQAVIKSGNKFESKPGRYLIDHFRRAIRKIRRKMKLPKSSITVKWISGHDGVEGNERADEEAKKAAENSSNNSLRKRLPAFLRTGPLPISISATKQDQRDITKKRWSRQWAKSPRYTHTLKYDKNLLAGSFVKLVSDLPRRQASVLIWLRTKHISLNAHLHRITKADTPDCPHCPGTKEDVPHFILKCPHYARERQIMTRHLRRRAYQLPHLLSHSKAIPHLMNYINSTGRLKATFGEVTTS